MIPVNTDTMLSRDALATALTAAGFPITNSTLATKACRGGGPEYRLFGRKPLYRWGDALDWARSRLSKAVTSSSELEVMSCATPREAA